MNKIKLIVKNFEIASATTDFLLLLQHYIFKVNEHNI